jgi:class 3 adenylate cyclase
LAGRDNLRNLEQVHEVKGYAHLILDDVASDPSGPGADAGNLAVLFADVSGSTRLYEELGDAKALETVGECLALVQRACENHGGRLVKTIGDEAMVVFAGADDAAEAAIGVQTAILAHPAIGSTHLAMRIGFHLGPAIEVGGDVYGDSVNIAARVVALAKRGQVITTAETTTALSPWLRARVREIDSLTLKSKLKDIRIFELICEDSTEELTALSTRMMPLPARIRLRHGERDLELGEASSVVTLGRDPQSDLVIEDRMASRRHARIERHRDKFVLVDQSTNGTYVTVEGEPEIQLRREELILRGRGHVSFGHAYLKDPTEVVAFSCVD